MLQKKEVIRLRFTATCALGLGAVFGLGILLTLLLAQVTGVSTAGDQHPGSGLLSSFFSIVGFVIGTAKQVGWVILPATVLWLLVRRLRSLAGYVAVAGTGILLIDLGLVTFAELAAAQPEGAAHLSGSFLAVMCGAFLLVFLPVIPSRWRGWAIAAAAALIVLTGVTAIAIGESHPLEVLGGWALGATWLTVVSRAFRRELADRGVPRHALWKGLCPDARAELAPAPDHDEALVAGRRSAAELAITAVLLVGLLVASGLLITRVLAPVRRFDRAVVEWFAGIRTDTLTVAAATIDHAGNTPGIIAVVILGFALTLGPTRRWAPPLFLLTAAAGETAIFLAAQGVVGRMRPAVEHLAGEPATSSFPSGHAAASIATYGGAALLVAAWSRTDWLRYSAFLLAGLIALAVAVARLYAGMHYPTDILASTVFAVIWLAACWRAFRPDRGAPGDAEDRRPQRRQSLREAG